MMARRHNSRSQSSSKDGPNDGHHLLESPPSSQRKSPNNSTLARRAMVIRKDMNSIQKIKCVLGLVMIVVVISLLNNIGGRQHHVLSERYDANDNNSAAETELLQALYDLPLPTTQKELVDLNDELAGLEPKFILQWAHHTLLAGNHNNLRSQETNGWNSHPLVQVTSFGPTGLVILDQLSKYNLLDTVPVITMDTLHLFKESYVFYDTVQSHYNSTLHLTTTKPVHIAHPPELDGDSVFKGFISSKVEFQDVYSPTLWKTDPRYYTKVTKIDPLQQKLEEWQTIMWITGRRRSQGGEREKLDVLEFDSFPPDEDNRRVRSEEDDNDNPFHSSKGRWKLNPLAYWSYDQVWKYVKANEVPYNLLYDLGFTSIGDEMTTTLPKKSHVGDAIYERSGRFDDLNRTECGLHSHLQKIKALKKKNEEAGEEWTVPELTCEKCIDLNEDTFLETVENNNLRDDSLLLLEFYSPFCGSCQEFAPVLNRLADYQIPNTIVARFDITEQNIPKYNNQELFQVESTPTLYLVGHSPSFYAEMYSGKHEFDAILQWLTEKRNSR
eukprot:scaffold2707_cov90-Skeletonema_dohrnii-CCMP3373.AAC.5